MGVGWRNRVHSGNGLSNSFSNGLITFNLTWSDDISEEAIWETKTDDSQILFEFKSKADFGASKSSKNYTLPVPFKVDLNETNEITLTILN